MAESTEAFSQSLADLASLLISEQTTASTLARIGDLAVLGLSGCDAASVSLLTKGDVSSAAFTSRLAEDGDGYQYREGEGPCLSSIEQRTTIHSNVLTEERRWPKFCQHAINRGIGSVLSLPLIAHHSVGALNLYSMTPGGFDELDRTHASRFAVQAGVALANAVVHDQDVALASQLREALLSRAIIDQAKGILMEREQCSADEAFEILRRTSQQTNRKVRDIAQKIIDSAAD